MRPCRDEEGTVIGQRLTVVALLLLISCNAPSGTGSRPSPTESVNPVTEAEIQEQLQCRDELEGFLEVLQELNSRLGVGVQFDTYLDLVGDVRVEYDQLPDLEQECLFEVGFPAETALRRYIAAANIWNECIGNLGCEFDSIEPDLQEKWAQAAELIEDAQEGLEGMGPAI
jgi:hypothetical protein